MNPIRTAAGLIQLPAHAAAAVAGTAAGVAATGARTTRRVVGWAVGRVAGPAPQPPVTSWVSEAPPAAAPEEGAPSAGPTPGVDAMLGIRTEAPSEQAATKQAPAKKAAAKKAPAKKAPAKKAPSRRAAVVAPALGLSEEEAQDLLRTPSGIPAAGEGVNPDTTETDLHQPGTEPLMDPATTKAVASESEMLRRAADPDKG